MTFSILAHDPDTGAIGGAAATGSLCVGGWVLRGDIESGMSASQGSAPSTFWGEDVLKMMRLGAGAQAAVTKVTSVDAGRAYRQLSALDLLGGVGAYTGNANENHKSSLAFAHGITAGNMLASKTVLDAMVTGFEQCSGPFARRLLAALGAADLAGGDSRGLLSSALLILHPRRAPLTLRIDHHPNDPLGALERLYEKATTGNYADWARQVPTLADKERRLD